VNPGPGFNQVLDVLRNEVCTYAADRSGKYEETARRGRVETRVETLHKELIEHIAESDDTLLQKYFDEGSLSEEVMRTGIHPPCRSRCSSRCSALLAKPMSGWRGLLDFIGRFGSSPVDRATAEAVDASDQPCRVSLTGKEPVAFASRR